MKKIISAILASVMLSASVQAFAKPLVHVSPWAYNDVEVFTSDGLLTPAFDEVYDYRNNITRGQFTELITNVMIKTGNLDQNFAAGYDYSLYSDIGTNIYYNAAIDYGLVNGEVVEYETDENGFPSPSVKRLYPDREITREDAAVIALRALERVQYSAAYYYSDPELVFSDKSSISSYARNAVARLSYSGIIGGMGDGSFNPKGNMTIEQAITMLYKLYVSLPSVPKPDGDGIDASTETTVQDYGNGYIETKFNNTLYVKNNSNSLAFDTDIYANIYCATASDGIVYSVAQTHSDNTDIFNVATGKLLNTIPYNTYKADSRYIYTKSARMGRMTFGLYGFDGREVLEPKYSLAEIDEYMSSGAITQYANAEADGWIYYSDFDDGGHMYKVDTNGNNKQKISNEDCYNLSYYDGWIYYSIKDENDGKLFCMKPDGTGVTHLSDYGLSEICDEFLYDGSGDRVAENDSLNKPYIFLIDYTSYVDTGIRKLYKVTHENDGTQKELVTDINIDYHEFYTDADGKNWIYFLDGDGINVEATTLEYYGGGSPLYRTDGDIVECIKEDVLMYNFEFMQSQDGEPLIRVMGENHQEELSWGAGGYYGGDGAEEVPSGVVGTYKTTVFDVDYIADINLNYIEDFKDGSPDSPNSSGGAYGGGSTNSNAPQVTTIEIPDEDESGNSTYTAYWEITIPAYVPFRMYFANADGNKIEIIPTGSIDSTRRYGDNLYFLVSDNILHTKRIEMHDMRTNERVTLLDNVVDEMLAMFNSSDYTPGYFNVADRNGNVWRCDMAKSIIKEIYPNSNSNRGGKTLALRPNSKTKSIIKVDESGYYCDIVTGVDPCYAIYVPNIQTIFVHGNSEYLPLTMGGSGSSIMAEYVSQVLSKPVRRSYSTYRISK